MNESYGSVTVDTSLHVLLDSVVDAIHTAGTTPTFDLKTTKISM